MKKITLIAVMFIFSNASMSFAGQFREKWGVVMSITPVSIITNYSQPHTKVICNGSNQMRSNDFANIAVGGIIGSVIGNKLSDVHGAGTIGALFGSMMAINSPQKHQTETCYEKTYYSNKNITKFSHFNIKVRTKRRILNVQSTNPYNVHDVIYLN